MAKSFGGNQRPIEYPCFVIWLVGWMPWRPNKQADKLTKYPGGTEVACLPLRSISPNQNYHLLLLLNICFDIILAFHFLQISSPIIS
jgi:hypothetical protein